MMYSSVDGHYWVKMGDSFVEKLNFHAVIKSAASAASPNTKIEESRGASGRRKRLDSPGILDLGLRGGCASSRLDHSLKVQLFYDKH